jgi:hypothetical protein
VLSARLRVQNHSQFQSAVEAVRFALSFIDRPPRPVASRMHARLKSCREYAALEPATLADVILHAVSRGGPFAMAIMTATVAPRSRLCNCGSDCCSGKSANFEWVRAIEIIAEEAMEKRVCRDQELLVECLRKVFGEKVSRRQIAGKLHIDEGTVGLHFKAIKQWVRGGASSQNVPPPAGVEQRVWRGAEKDLRAAQLIQ